MTTTRRKTVTALVRRSVTTTSCVGAIGVSPASTRKVTSADSSASATAAKPSVRGSHPGAGAAAAVANSAGAALPTSVIKISRPKRQPVTVRQNRPLGRPLDHRWYFPVMLLYNNVAGLRQIRGMADRAVAIRHQACREPAIASIAAAEDLNIEVPDLLPQRVAVDPEKVGGPDLVRQGGREGHR